MNSEVNILKINFEQIENLVLNRFDWDVLGILITLYSQSDLKNKIRIKEIIYRLYEIRLEDE